MEYCINGQITLDDYIQFYKAQTKIRRLIVLICLFWPILLILLISLSIREFFWVLNVFPIFGIVGTLCIGYNLIDRSICKGFYNSSDLSKNIQNIIIEKERITIEAGSFKSTINKANFKKIIRDRDSIYILSTEKVSYIKIGYIIKKQFIENENDFEKIIEFIKLNFGKIKAHMPSA